MGKEKEIGIDHIYVVHAPQGYEQHAVRLQSILTGQYEFDYEILEKDREELIDTYFVPDIRQILGRGALMCTLNHILFYELMISNGDRLALILEDDPCFSRNFIAQLQQIILEAEALPDGFFISLENSGLKFPPKKILQKDRHLYPASSPRCAGAYLLDITAAKNIMRWLSNRKCDQVIDFWFNTLMEENVFTMYWAHPPFVEQASLNGKMHSTMSSKQQSTTRRISWIAQKLYKTHILPFFR
ncbi:MAG: glycosyltransferase family 25 protein [Bacteroidales bacterium]|jgi:glycosyl transferase family 25|nr:glycosyltransferase family 25 protein [Bacteroidales bacterium]